MQAVRLRTLCLRIPTTPAILGPRTSSLRQTNALDLLAPEAPLHCIPEHSPSECGPWHTTQRHRCPLRVLKHPRFTRTHLEHRQVFQLQLIRSPMRCCKPKKKRCKELCGSPWTRSTCRHHTATPHTSNLAFRRNGRPSHRCVGLCRTMALAGERKCTWIVFCGDNGIAHFSCCETVKLFGHCLYQLFTLVGISAAVPIIRTRLRK